MIVNKTNDYNMLSFIDGNRNINESQLTRLTKSIEDNYIPIPIVVNEKKQIIDLTRISDGELKRLKQVLTNAIAPSGSRGDEKVIEGVYKK